MSHGAPNREQAMQPATIEATRFVATCTAVGAILGALVTAALPAKGARRGRRT